MKTGKTPKPSLMVIAENKIKGRSAPSTKIGKKPCFISRSQHGDCYNPMKPKSVLGGKWEAVGIGSRAFFLKEGSVPWGLAPSGEVLLTSQGQQPC